MKTLIGIPALSWVYTDFLQSMLALDKPDASMMIQKNSLVYDARNNIAGAAIKHGFDRVFYVDSDMVFSADLFERLGHDMDVSGADLVCGYFTTRSTDMRPCVYSSVTIEDNGKANAEPYYNHPAGLFVIGGCGFGAVLVKTDLIKKVADKYGAPFAPLPTVGEDISFCWRAANVGALMMCDGDLNVGHIGTVIFGEGQNV